jgi:hypothetical protein
MNKRISIGDILFLVVALAALILLSHFFSPPAGFVFSCMTVGAALPLLYRVVRRFLPRLLWSLPVIPLIVFTLSLSYHFPTIAHRMKALILWARSIFPTGTVHMRGL